VLAAVLMTLWIGGVVRAAGEGDDGRQQAPIGSAVTSGEPRPVTYRAQGYSPVADRAPTADSSQSKMWHTDGSQWALMVTDGAGSAVHVFELTTDYSWRDTGTVVDTRRASADALWLPASQSLVVALSDPSAPVRIVRFSYDSATRTWDDDPAYPRTLRTGDGTGSTVIDEDSTGRLWITYTRESTVWVAHSDRSGLAWSAPFPLPVPDAEVSWADISSLIAFDGSIGVMWSDQQSRTFRFAIHRDADPLSAWSVETPATSDGQVEDHLHLQVASTERGVYVYAAVETTRESAGPNGSVLFAPGVLVRRPASAGAGRWSQEAAGAWGDHRQPILMVEKARDRLFLLTRADSGPDDAPAIFYKTSSLTDVSFEPGIGQRFLNTTEPVTDVTGSKQDVSVADALTVLAVAPRTNRYAYARLGVVAP
jgi:hypothetical protein